MHRKPMGARAIKPKRRRSVAVRTGSGDITSMIALVLDARTTVYCKDKAAVAHARKKWEERMREKENTMKLFGDTASRSPEYKREYLKKMNEKNREKAKARKRFM